MSLSRPEAGSGIFADAEAPYNPEIEDAGDPVIQSMGLSLLDAGVNPEVFSLLDLQCSPPPAVRSQPRSLRMRPTRRPRAFTPLFTSVQAEIVSLLSIPESSPSAPVSDAADREFSEPKNLYRKQAQHQTVRRIPQKHVTTVTVAIRNQQIESHPSSNLRRTAVTRTKISNRALVAISVARQLSGTRSSSRTPVVMAVAQLIRTLIVLLNSESYESLHRRSVYRN